MTSELSEPSERLVRRLSRSAEAIHTLTYYCPEISRMTEEGFRGWWHAYFAYRSAPLGEVDAPLVTAVFYNFAPRMVARAVPGVWRIMAPARVLDRRLELVGDAVERIWGDGRLDAVLGEAADLARAAMADIETEGRPLAAAHAALDWPAGPPGLVLWHACTVWREYRGDAHNIALAASGIDGIEAHLLMAAHGRGNQATITSIRGWTPEEWAGARSRLVRRDILRPDGSYTEAGRALRAGIEAITDDLCSRPVATVGADRAARLAELLATVAADLLQSGAVPGTWPPPTVLQR